MKNQHSITIRKYSDQGNVRIGGRSPAFRTAVVRRDVVSPSESLNPSGTLAPKANKAAVNVRIGGRSPAFRVVKTPAANKDAGVVRVGGRSPAFRI